ncbi:response regulator transcription factor [Granulosicoccaceae sp. 1_MG-2023]|nr:response regulator transcription factor [Granulosicoccaceae sp. 1_MG-2023]
MNNGKITVLLVDDHEVVRAGYGQVLSGAADIELIAEAGSGEEGYSAYVTHQPDVVIMDISLPGISGIEAIRRITAREDTARILVFSMHEDTVFVDQALQAGALGYITKRSAADTLVEAVRTVAGGQRYLDAALAQTLAMEKTRGRSNTFSDLSTREFEIFCLLAEGLQTNAIAERLSIAPKTVANYSTQIKYKLGVKTHAEIAHLAIRHGLIRP